MISVINYIVKFWRDDARDSSPARLTILTERINAVRDNQTVGMLKNGDIFAWTTGGSGRHYSEIRPDSYYCSCVGFATSSPTEQQKQPCKHLYTLASGTLTNW